ncbi:ribosomal-protein-alanine N-acetyltransferase [Methanomicrobium sp. W14]|nr:ribosomal-protein-alanine N-acetyltransferase [Methanomicrobium sp. W14]
MSEEDLFSVCMMLEKRNVCEWLFFGPNSFDETNKYFKPLISSMKQDLLNNRPVNIPVFTIKDRRSGFFVGQCGLIPDGFCGDVYTIGYQLDDICWRRGFGTEACRFLIYYAFFVAKGRRLNGDCMAGNKGSQRIMEKCGFKKEGLQRDYCFKNGKYHDRIFYGLLKDCLDEDWQNILISEFW